MDQEQPQPVDRQPQNKGRGGKATAILIRLLPPIAILAVGLIGFSVLSFEPEEPKKARREPRPSENPTQLEPLRKPSATYNLGGQVTSV